MRLVLGLLLLAAAGCDALGLDDRAELRAGEVEIALGETARLDGLAIRFDAVVTDSRCPLDVVCASAGEAIVGLAVGDRPVELRVAAPETSPREGVRVGDVALYAVALVPYPRTDRPSDARPVVTLATVVAGG